MTTSPEAAVHPIVRVRSISHAEDAAYLALADTATAAPAQSEACGWRLVGGHMVNLHAARAGIALPPRATMDTDVGLELLTIKTGALVERLRALGYANSSASNRFERALPDAATAAIDILAPAPASRHRPNLKAGQIHVDGVPGLHIALARPPGHRPGARAAQQRRQDRHGGAAARHLLSHRVEGPGLP